MTGNPVSLSNPLEGLEQLLVQSEVRRLQRCHALIVFTCIYTVNSKIEGNRDAGQGQRRDSIPFSAIVYRAIFGRA